MLGSRHRRYVGPFLLAGSLAAGHAILVHQPLGLTPDSVAYLTAARSLFEEGTLVTIDLRTGLPVPLAHFPPLYSMVLAATGLVSGGPGSGASLLQAVLLTLNLSLLGWWVARDTEARFLWMPAVLLCAAFPGILLIHAMVWSEPLFTLFSLASLALLARGIATDEPGDLRFSALLASLAVLTRYIGIAVIVAGVTAVLLFRGSGWKERFGAAARYLAVASCLPVGWLVATLASAGSLAARSFGWHPPGASELHPLVDTVLGWLLGWPVPLGVGVGAGLAILSAVIWSLTRGEIEWRSKEGAQPHARATARVSAGVAGIYTVSFFLVVLLARSAVDAMVPLGERMLAPLAPIYVLLLFLAADAAARTSRFARTIAILLVTFLVAGQVARGASWLATDAGKGQGYIADRWRESEAIAFVRDLPSDVPVYSNQADAIYHLAGRVSPSIPWFRGYEGVVEEAELRERFRAWGDEVRRNDGLVVYFHDGRDEIPPLDRVARACGAVVIARLADAVVLRCSEADEADPRAGIPRG